LTIQELSAIKNQTLAVTLPTPSASRYPKGLSLAAVLDLFQVTLNSLDHCFCLPLGFKPRHWLWGPEVEGGALKLLHSFKSLTCFISLNAAGCRGLQPL